MAVRDFACDPVTGDWQVTGAVLATVADEAAVLQAIDIHVQSFLGENWLDESLGIPWHQQILGRGAPQLLVQALIGREIATVPDVTEVLAVSYSGPDANRAVKIGYRVRTTFSTSPVEGVVQVTAP